MAEVTVCNTVDAGSSPARTSKIGCNSMVECRTVNAKVAGSSPATRAIRAWHSGCVLDSKSSYVGSIPAVLANKQCDSAVANYGRILTLWRCAGPCGRLRRCFATFPPKQSFCGAFQRDDLIDAIRKTDALLESAVMHGEEAEAERLRAKLRRLAAMGEADE